MTDGDDGYPAHHRVRFAPEALEQLDEIEDYILSQGSPLAAVTHVDAIVDACVRLAHMPHRGTQRNDIRRGLRTTVYGGNTVIAYEIDDDLELVSIIGILSASQDWPRLLSG